MHYNAKPSRTTPVALASLNKQCKNKVSGKPVVRTYLTNELNNAVKVRKMSSSVTAHSNCIGCDICIPVGKIPGPSDRRRASSREELNRPFQSHMRTVSRSVSVLAPWKPRYSEQYEINYDQQQQLHQQHAKPTDHTQRRQLSHETLSRQGKESRNADQKDSSSKFFLLESYPRAFLSLTLTSQSYSYPIGGKRCVIIT